MTAKRRRPRSVVRSPQSPREIPSGLGGRRALLRAVAPVAALVLIPARATTA